MKQIKPITFFILSLLTAIGCFGQEALQTKIENDNTITLPEVGKRKSRDIVEVLHIKRKDNGLVEMAQERKKINLSLVPAFGYTLQTGIAGLVSFNVAFYTDTALGSKISQVQTSFTYSQYNQIIFPLFVDVWSKNKKYNYVSDNRFISYPSDIYGLGGRVDPNQGYTINFVGIKAHESIFRNVHNDFFLGIGYYYDQFWNIKSINPETKQIERRIQKELMNNETASGIALKALYDSRTNQINPNKGLYFNAVYRDNRKFLGSDSKWSSLLLDTRYYLPFPRKSGNVLAFWSYDWLTPQGNPPYLLLPSTGWDDQYNTGRGYIQGRFRGKNMVYFESEYRFKISANGLIGGVAFFNTETFSGELSKQYTYWNPGLGGGVRIKLNKHSGTNLCIDYGFGSHGSNGVFVNLGEVF